MPPVTEPDIFKFYIPGPACNWPSFRALCLAVSESNSASTLGKSFFEEFDDYLVAYATDTISLYLTIMSVDLFNNPRPYDCDALIDCMSGDIDLRCSPSISFSWLTRPRIAFLITVIGKTIEQPLFEHEKEELIQVHAWLKQHADGPVISAFMETW